MWVLTKGYCSVTNERLYATDMYHVPGGGPDGVRTCCRCHDETINHVPQPGRELDYLVAEVIGMKREDIPNFSTDISAAWTIIEGCEDWEVRFSYKENWVPPISKKYYCYFYGLHNKLGEGWSEVSIPHAICLAVLRTTDAPTNPNISLANAKNRLR